MPELPEVETTVKGIRPYVLNSTITAIKVRNDSLRWPVPTTILNNLIGEKIVEASRRAKYILLKTESATILLHLGMSGSLRILKNGHEPTKHDHIDIELNHDHIIRYNDPRRFGCCLVLEEPIEEHKLLNQLGPEPLTKHFSADRLFKLSRAKSVAIKNFIMDGKVVVGVGNIYASESLFIAGIRPSVKSGKLSKKRYLLLVEAIKFVLVKAIKAGGTTLSDFNQVDGKPGYFSQELQVYGREGLDCYQCTSQIKSKIIGQRNTFFCPKCQRY